MRALATAAREAATKTPAPVASVVTPVGMPYVKDGREYTPHISRSGLTAEEVREACHKGFVVRHPVTYKKHGKPLTGLTPGDRTMFVASTSQYALVACDKDPDDEYECLYRLEIGLVRELDA